MKNKTAIFYITDNGLALAKRLKGLYPDAEIIKFTSESIQELWDKCRRLIFIMAAGVVVRTVAPLIQNKRTDPAVIVLDEKGRFAVSLLSGHLGGANESAGEIARFLGGEAVITTASDINSLQPIDMFAQKNGLAIDGWELVPQIGTMLVNNGILRVYTEVDLELPAEFLKVSEPGFADVLITNKIKLPLPPLPLLKEDGRDCRLYLRPKNLVAGIGCNSGTPLNEVEHAISSVLDANNLSFLSLDCIATIDIKAGEPGVAAFAESHGLPIASFSPAALNSVKNIEQSNAAFKATGANAVAEPAALLASGNRTLLVSKQKTGNVTVAVAEKRIADSKNESGQLSNCKVSGKLYIIGTGPGSIEQITPHAQQAIRKADAIIGYGTYLDLIDELIKGKEIFTTGMTQETERCKKAVELSLKGKTVAVISGGDPGIYAMAGLVFELLRAESIEQSAKNTVLECPVSIEVIPGISALNACASRLGAPLMHDFACISLSDRLTPWELIEERLEAAARADFVIVLYNPRSMGRPEHINKAQAICLTYRSAETPVGIVKAAMRENESLTITNLRDMLNHDIDMQTTVIIGNSKTFVWNEFMITPRGYEKKLNL